MTEGKNRAAVLTEISLILAAVFFGLNFAATKYAAGFVPPLLIVGIRFTVGGLLMLCVLRVLEPGGSEVRAGSRNRCIHRWAPREASVLKNASGLQREDGHPRKDTSKVGGT